MAVIFHPAPPCQGPRPLEGWGVEKANVLRRCVGAVVRRYENSTMIQHLSGNQLPSHLRGGVSEAGVG